MVEHVASKLESYAQSGDVVDVLDEFIINATEIPVGGAKHATYSRLTEDVMNNISVNAVNNADEHWSTPDDDSKHVYFLLYDKHDDLIGHFRAINNIKACLVEEGR